MFSRNRLRDRGKTLRYGKTRRAENSGVQVAQAKMDTCSLDCVHRLPLHELGSSAVTTGAVVRRGIESTGVLTRRAHLADQARIADVLDRDVMKIQKAPEEVRSLWQRPAATFLTRTCRLVVAECAPLHPGSHRSCRAAGLPWAECAAAVPAACTPQCVPPGLHRLSRRRLESSRLPPCSDDSEF